MQHFLILFPLSRSAVSELLVPVPELLAVDVLEGPVHLVLHQDCWF